MSNGQNPILEALVDQQERSYLPVQEVLIWSLVWGDPLEEEMATHSSVLAWKIPWAEEPGMLQTVAS